jgi:uncharacterized small protein (DUF1192 family)
MKPRKRNKKPVAASIPVAPVPPVKSPLKELFEKWIAPVVLALIVAAASYTFVDRVSKLESVVADLQKTVAELDASYSKESESKGTLEANVQQLQIDVGVLKDEVERLLK